MTAPISILVIDLAKSSFQISTMGLGGADLPPEAP